MKQKIIKASISEAFSLYKKAESLSEQIHLKSVHDERVEKGEGRSLNK